MSASGNLNWTSLVTDLPLSDSFRAPDGEDLPWAKIWSHAFKGPGGQWYIENSLTTLGKDDPVGEMNRELWNSGRDSDKEIARAQKRKLSLLPNIYVVSDPAHPENEGKVFLQVRKEDL